LNSLNKDLRLYGAARCHKTQFYLEFLKSKDLEFQFLDVEENQQAAEELRSLYNTGKLNFPTILLKGKKLRNPTIPELEKWLIKKDISLG
jgi:arsenate reductase-like glutaredoxin family protein